MDNVNDNVNDDNNVLPKDEDNSGNTSPTPPADDAPKFVSKEAYEKVMQDMHKYKQKLKEFEAKNKDC